MRLERIERINTARQSRNQKAGKHILAGITPEDNVFARRATNLTISSTERAQRTQSSQRRKERANTKKPFTTLEFNESCGITRWRVPAGGARIHSARQGHRRGGRAFLPSPRLAGAA